MMQNHLEISLKYHFWTRKVRNWSKSLTESWRKVDAFYGTSKTCPGGPIRAHMGPHGSIYGPISGPYMGPYGPQPGQGPNPDWAPTRAGRIWIVARCPQRDMGKVEGGGIFFATCTLDILEILQISNITLWLLCRHVYCNLQAGYTVTLIFGVLQPSGLVASKPPRNSTVTLTWPWSQDSGVTLEIFNFWYCFLLHFSTILECHLDRILLKNLKNKDSRAAWREFTKIVRKKMRFRSALNLEN